MGTLRSDGVLPPAVAPNHEPSRAAAERRDVAGDSRRPAPEAPGGGEHARSLVAAVRGSLPAGAFRCAEVARGLGVEGQRDPELAEELRDRHGQRLCLPADLPYERGRLGQAPGQGALGSGRTILVGEPQGSLRHARVHDRGHEVCADAPVDLPVRPHVAHLQEEPDHHPLGTRAVAGVSRRVSGSGRIDAPTHSRTSNCWPA